MFKWFKLHQWSYPEPTYDYDGMLIAETEKQYCKRCGVIRTVTCIPDLTGWSNNWIKYSYVPWFCHA
jgi:hypothetical protein